MLNFSSEFRLLQSSICWFWVSNVSFLTFILGSDAGNLPVTSCRNRAEFLSSASIIGLINDNYVLSFYCSISASTASGRSQLHTISHTRFQILQVQCRVWSKWRRGMKIEPDWFHLLLNTMSSLLSDICHHCWVTSLTTEQRASCPSCWTWFPTVPK